jgi:hypothetical protein
MSIDIKIPEAFKKKYRTTYFDPNQVILSPPKYVAWIDIMGSSQLMRKSHVKSAIAIGHFNSSVLTAAADISFPGEIYPLVDGVYITTDNRTHLQTILKYIMKLNAINFLLCNSKNTDDHRIVRGAIAFGQVIEGKDLVGSARIFDEWPEYTKNILLGAPLALAHAAERSAAPFGIWVDESARQFSPNLDGAATLRWTNWQWWNYPSKDPMIDDDCIDIEKMLSEKVKKYFDWCRDNYIMMMYDKNRLEDHAERARQFFPSWK